MNRLIFLLAWLFLFCEVTKASEAASHHPEFNFAADFRPSTSLAGSYSFDNELAFSYSPRPNLNIGYYQRVAFDLASAQEETEDRPDFHEGHDGFLQINLEEFTALGKVKFDFNGRLYAPTGVDKRQRGFLTAAAALFTAIVPLSPHASISLTDGPLLHVYGQSEFQNETTVANPFFENRTTLSINFSFFSDRLSASLPINWHQFLHSGSDSNAKYSGSWTHALWLNPQLVWNFDSNTCVGVGYESENLLADSNGLVLSEGLGAGAFQLIYQIKI